MDLHPYQDMVKVIHYEQIIPPVQGF